MPPFPGRTPVRVPAVSLWSDTEIHREIKGYSAFMPEEMLNQLRAAAPSREQQRYQSAFCRHPAGAFPALRGAFSPQPPQLLTAGSPAPAAPSASQSGAPGPARRGGGGWPAPPRYRPAAPPAQPGRYRGGKIQEAASRGSIPPRSWSPRAFTQLCGY